MTGSGCRKTLAPSEFVSITPTKECSTQSSTGGFFAVLPQLALPPSIAVAGACPLAWREYGLPPPTDLVITLQHFVI